MTDTFVDIGCWSECQSGTTTPFKSTMTTSEMKMKPHKVNYSTNAWSNANDASRRALFPCENSWDFNREFADFLLLGSIFVLPRQYST